MCNSPGQPSNDEVWVLASGFSLPSHAVGMHFKVLLNQQCLNSAPDSKSSKSSPFPFQIPCKANHSMITLKLLLEWQINTLYSVRSGLQPSCCKPHHHPAAGRGVSNLLLPRGAFGQRSMRNQSSNNILRISLDTRAGGFFGVWGTSLWSLCVTWAASSSS